MHVWPQKMYVLRVNIIHFCTYLYNVLYIICSILTYHHYQHFYGRPQNDAKKTIRENRKNVKYNISHVSNGQTTVLCCVFFPGVCTCCCCYLCKWYAIFIALFKSTLDEKQQTITQRDLTVTYVCKSVMEKLVLLHFFSTFSNTKVLYCLPLLWF